MPPFELWNLELGYRKSPYKENICRNREVLLGALSPSPGPLWLLSGLPARALWAWIRDSPPWNRPGGRSPLRYDGEGAVMLPSVTWSSSCSFPTTWAGPRETETVLLPASLCGCPFLFLESPGPWGPDLPHPLTPQLRFYDSICLEFSTSPHHLSPTDLFAFLYLYHGL